MPIEVLVLRTTVSYVADIFWSITELNACLHILKMHVRELQTANMINPVIRC